MSLILPLLAAGSITFASHIRTLQLKVDGSEETFPVLKLGGNEQLSVSFDDLTHEYRRYTYRIVHCDVEGNPTEDLFDSEYLSSATGDAIIENYEQSENTTVEYTHYSFTIPSQEMRPKISGNYRVSIFTESDEDDDEEVEVARAYFGVVDPEVSISASCSTDTEVDWNNQHQQLTLSVDCSRLTLRDAQTDVKLVVMQNRRQETAVIAPKPTGQNGSTLLWEHSRDLIFKAGNEYRKTEIISTRYPGLHGESVRWHEPYYHYTLQTDYPRRNYLYDEDRNGLYVTRWDGSGDEDVYADYVVMHFRLNTLPLTEKGDEVYVSGRWNSSPFAPECKMQYNEKEECYTADILAKCGYYNYLYLVRDASGQVKTLPFEGDFFQTENEYDILVYYHPVGGRYWQLVGCTTPTYRKK